MSQNPNQEIKYTSGFLNEDEEVNESEFDELAGEQETSKLAHNQQKNPEEREQPKKTKRPRKTIEQELAELDARRQRLMEKKRSEDARKKIVFGAASIKALSKFCNMREWEELKRCLRENVYKKDKGIIEEIIKEIENK